MYDGNFYKSLKKSPLTPAPKVFKTAWVVLYILMFAALFFVLIEHESVFRTKAISFFALQFLLNLLWSPVFFVFEMPKAALLLTIMLVIAVGTTIYFFSQVSLLGFLLMIPYWFWVCFACYLNWEIVVLNPERHL